jgi:two-component system cell cycle sensor histidine kinase/response regulator CckA
LEESLLHLLSHAVEAMPEGGTVTIETQATEGGRPAVQIKVSDTGRGLDGETLPHIFEPYMGAKTVGEGLGLAMIHGFVTKSGGSIEATSTPGQGTQFTITLPQVPETASAQALRNPAETPVQHPVLVVEDEPAVRKLLAYMLRSHGYEVWEAADGIDAMEQVETMAPRSCRLIVTDVLMPRMDGPTLVQRLRERAPFLKVLFLSGYAEVDRFKTQPHSDVFLQKPLSAHTLLTKVEELLKT